MRPYGHQTRAASYKKGVAKVGAADCLSSRKTLAKRAMALEGPLPQGERAGLRCVSFDARLGRGCKQRTSGETQRRVSPDEFYPQRIRVESFLLHIASLSL
jgi:hypothetical protein